MTVPVRPSRSRPPVNTRLRTRVPIGRSPPLSWQAMSPDTVHDRRRQGNHVGVCAGEFD